MGQRNWRIAALLAGVALATALPFAAQASHSWGGYHWARTANPVTLRVIDSMTADWDDNLVQAIADWDRSDVLSLVRETGDASDKSRRRCPAISGKVRVCNGAYGRNGWLGLAQIWVSGSHITQATAKVNDTYLYAGSSYTEINRQHVICQEIGHDWGLGHQDESGADLDTCMDYSRALDNPTPNAHDYEELGIIYSHLDASTTAAVMSAGFAHADVTAPESWGRRVSESADGRSAIFVREFGSGLRILTHVTWAR